MDRFKLKQEEKLSALQIQFNRHFLAWIPFCKWILLSIFLCGFFSRFFFPLALNANIQKDLKMKLFYELKVKHTLNVCINIIQMPVFNIHWLTSSGTICAIKRQGCVPHNVNDCVIKSTARMRQSTHTCD